MHSKPATNQTDPHDVFVIEPDVVLAARADNASSTPAHGAMKDRLTALAGIASSVSAGTPTPSVDTTFRATEVDDIPVRAAPSSTGKFAKGVFMVLFAICGAAAAAAWPHYEDAAKQVIASFVPSFALTSQASPQTPAAEQPASATDQTAEQASATDRASATDQATAQPAPAAQAAAPVAAPPADPALVQSMARDIASMGQQIEQLKASIEQLRSGQEQMSRDIAKNSEVRTSETRMPVPTPRPRIAPPPRVAAAPLHKPKPAYAHSPSPAYPSAPPAAAPVYPPAAVAAMPPPYAPPTQAAAEPDGEPVVRPPMPVR